MGSCWSFTPGDPNGTSVPGPFFDSSQDLVGLELTKLGNTNYQARVTQLVAGFATPIDAEIIGNRIYVIEYSGNQGLWEIRFPPARGMVRLSAPAFQNNSFRFTLNGLIVGLPYQIQASSNLVSWSVARDFVATNSQFEFTESALGISSRFYRVLQP